MGSTSSQTFTANYTFTSGGLIYTPWTTAPSDFHMTGTTCQGITDPKGGGGTTYGAGNTCSITVQFTPQGPGNRNQAIELFGITSNGSSVTDEYGIATAFFIGQATGGQISLPATEVVATSLGTVPSELPGTMYEDYIYEYPMGIASAGEPFMNGNLAIGIKMGDNQGDTSNFLVGAMIDVNIADNLSPNATQNYLGPVLNYSNGYGEVEGAPGGVAVDSGQNVFWTNQGLYGNGKVLKLTYDHSVIYNQINRANSEVIYSGTSDSSQSDVAEDGAGNIYITDPNNDRVLLLYANANGYVQTVLANSSNGLSNPIGVAADALGNVFVSDSSNGNIYTFTNTQGAYSKSQLGNVNYPLSMAVDSADDLYVVNNYGVGTVEKLTPSGAESTVNSSANGISYVAVDPWQNLLISDVNNRRILREVTSTGNGLNFSNVDLNGQSAAQSLTLTNTGNAPLTFASIQFPTNFPQQALSTDCETGVPVAVGSSCTLTAVVPATSSTGTQSGSITVTHDNGITQSFPVTATIIAPTGITVMPGSAIVAPNGTQQFTATGVNRDGKTPNLTSLVTWISSNPAVATISSTGLATALAVGTTTITATYGSATSNSVTLKIPVTATMITLIATPNPSTYGKPVTLTATVSSIAGAPPNGETILLDAQYVGGGVLGNPTLSGGVASLTTSALPAGTNSFIAIYAGDVSFVSSSSTVSITVNQASQTITFPTITGAQVPLTSVTLAATASSGLAVSYTSLTPAVCSVTGSSASLLASGACTIQAAQAGNAAYSAAISVSVSFSVIKVSQTITFPAITSIEYANSSFSLTASASSGLTVSFISSTPTVCTVTGSKASLLTSGTCSLEATQVGNAAYSAATPVYHSFWVSHSPQTITFPAITGTQLPLTSVTLKASASSGLVVSYTSSTPTVCAVTGSTASLLTSGACTIKAAQAGSSAYLAATSVSVSFKVTSLA